MRRLENLERRLNSSEGTREWRRSEELKVIRREEKAVLRKTGTWMLRRRSRTISSWTSKRRRVAEAHERLRNSRTWIRCSGSVRREVEATADCENTTPNPRTRRTSAHVIFSRLAQSRLESSSQQESFVSRETSHPHNSHSISHASSLLFLSHLSTTSLPHLHSYPTNLAFHFTRRYSLRGSIECVFRSPDGTALAYRLYEPKDLTEEDTSVQVKPMFLPQTEYELLPCWIGFGRWASAEHAGFTFLFTRELQPDHKFITPTEKSVSSSSRFRASAENAAMFSQRRKSSQETFSGREGFLQYFNQFKEQIKALSSLSESEKAATLALEESKDLLAEAKLEVLKKECRVDFLDGSICELQRTNSFESYGDWPYQSWKWNISKRAGQTSRRIGAARKRTSRNSNQKYSRRLEN